MEKFNSKLAEKYKNLKKRKLLEEEEWNLKRGSDIKNYQNAVESLVEEYKKENERLRSEMASMLDRYAECQKLLLEENRKSKDLSTEVGRLQNLLLQQNSNNNNASQKSPYTSSRTRSGKTYKGSSKKKTPNSCSMQDVVQYKESAVVPYESSQEEQIVPDCCRRSMTSPGGAEGKCHTTCAFQSLMEYLVGMKFSLECQIEGLNLSVIHQRSGYTFTLTWVRGEDEGDGEMMYRVSSLGTLERVALDWMKEDMIFSMTMCPVFFERISRVVGRS